ncbi:MAG: type II toxin-antitoxin system VapC family toxin [Verrucomicrobia bacterium]|nr:type II toxin-antitoxin system VapC family toxin [Verrucomicrobiota bacterium]
MPGLCDVSYLLPLCHGQHEHHLPAKEHLDTVDVSGQLVVCRISQLGLLRLLSNPAVMMSSACTTNQAWQVYDTMMADDRFIFQGEPGGLEARLRELTDGFPFSPKLWQDACLAAFAITAGLQLVTFDSAFRKFKGLECVTLAVK